MTTLNVHTNKTGDIKVRVPNDADKDERMDAVKRSLCRRLKRQYVAHVSGRYPMRQQLNLSNDPRQQPLRQDALQFRSPHDYRFT